VAPPRTVRERSQQSFASSRPLEKTRESQGLSGLSTADKSAWISAHLLTSPGSIRKLSVKAQRDCWRHVNDASQPIRTVRKQEASQSWGKDAKGKDIGDYTPDEFGGRAAKAVQLTALEVAHRVWLAKDAVSAQDVETERQRRKEMAKLTSELYGRSTTKYAQDPDWDDVEPIPQEDPKDALAAIAYPEHYASGETASRSCIWTIS
jgi:protein farnesyltransferase/geranylgeranyltransferase type-1 subunit alpha